MHQMNLEYAYERFVGSLHGILKGEGLSSFVIVPNAYGKQANIFNALNDAVICLQTRMHAEHLELVNKACRKLGFTNTSDQANEIAAGLLNLMVRRAARR